MNLQRLLAFFGAPGPARDNLLAQWDRVSQDRNAKKTARAAQPKAESGVLVEFFFPLSTAATPKHWKNTLLRHQRKVSREIAKSALVFQSLGDKLARLHESVHAQIGKAVSPARRAAFNEAWDAHWLQGASALMSAYVLNRDQALHEKNMESSVLFHIVQSLSAEPDLNTLLNTVVHHAGMLMRTKQVCFFWADEPREAPGVERRLHLKATNQPGVACGEYSLAFGEGEVGRAAVNREALIVHEYQATEEKIPFLAGADKLLIAPVFFAGEILGVLVIADSKKRKRFTNADRELLMIFVSQIAATLKTVMLYQRQTETAAVLEEKNRILESQSEIILRKKAQLEVINDIGQQINSSLDLPEVLSLLTRHAAECIGVNRSLVWLMNDKKTGLDAVAAFGFPQGLVGRLSLFLPEIRKTRLFQALFERHAVEIAAGQDQELFEGKLKALQPFQVMLAVPLLLKQQAVGLLMVDDTRERHEFLEDEVNLVSAVANQAVLAIENARLYQQVKEQAITDVMTGLYNHRYFQIRFTEEFSNCKRYGNALSVIMLDIDHFKHYNDTYGHIAGDLALKEIAQLTRASVRENDILARYGGEEFVIILPMTGLEGAQIVADRIRRAVQECRFLGNFSSPQVSMTVSLGISTYSPSHGKCEMLLREADVALYRAKGGGRNQTVVFQPGMIESTPA